MSLGPGKKKRPSKEQSEKQKQKRRERNFTAAHRRIFERAGFTRLQPVDGIHFTFEGIVGELDDIFVYENVVVIAEYTISGSDGIGKHAKGKNDMHNRIIANPTKFLEEFSTQSAGVMAWRAALSYTPKQIIICSLYCTQDPLEDNHRALFNSTKFMAEGERRYFLALTKTLMRSSRYELFEYLGIDAQKVGRDGTVPTSIPFDSYRALLLPEEQSHFPSGFSVVSFYVDPDALLKRAFVLRRNGWRDGLGLYQRLIIPKKISAIRSHLKEKKRVFANNIVVTLSPDVRLLSENGSAIVHSEIVEPALVKLEMPRRAGSIGIIDGQHRIFSYFEDDRPDADIDRFRVQQNLLATGLIYPAGMSPRDRERFEANLFLEINSTQTGAGTDIIQAIWVVLDPFRPVSVAKVVLDRLADRTPLKGILARSGVDSNKVPTSTIVAYGLQPLTKRSGKDSLFHIWDNLEAKERFISGARSDDDLEAYISFCVSTISEFLNRIKSAVGNDRWAVSGKDGVGILSVTTINGLIILLRKLISEKVVLGPGKFPRFDELSKFDFRSYKSSQYADMATALTAVVVGKRAVP